MVTGRFVGFGFFSPPLLKKNSYQFNIIPPVNNNSYLKRSLR